MSSPDKTAKGQTSSIAFEFDLRHPPEKVWRTLTEPALLEQWLLPVVGLELRPGTAFAFQAPAQPDWDGAVSCQLLEIEEKRKLRYTWVVGDMRTVVTFTLTPSASGTRLSLLHSGFTPQQKANFAGARYGWTMMGEQLVDLLARLP